MLICLYILPCSIVNYLSIFQLNKEDASKMAEGTLAEGLLKCIPAKLIYDNEEVSLNVRQHVYVQFLLLFLLFGGGAIKGPSQGLCVFF